MEKKGPGKLSPKERAKLQKERKQMSKEVKKHNRSVQKSKNAQVKSRSGQPPVNINSAKRTNSRGSTPVRKNNEEEKVRAIRRDDYRDEFFVDETVKRRKTAKKIKENKKKRQRKTLTPRQRKVRHIFAYCTIFIVILCIGVVLSLTVLFKTEKISVKGNTLYDENTIVELSGVKLEQNIFLAKWSATPNQIIDALPYVEDAKVDFTIPDTITITIKNADPAYVIISDGKYYKVSGSGRILEIEDSDSQQLPVLKCSELTVTEVGKYISFKDENFYKILSEISDCLEKNEFTNVNLVDMNETANISLIYDKRIKIVLGLPEDIDYKLRTAMTIINQKLDPEGTGVISGTLNVSECSTTKKSYFKDGTISETIPGQTQPVTVPETTAPADTSPDDVQNVDDSYDFQSSDDGGYTPNDVQDSDESADYGDTPNYSDSADYSGADNDTAGDGYADSGSGDSVNYGE